jgi:spermidine/putrescine transport system permease protein
MMKILRGIFIGIMAVFLYLPIVYIVLFAFNDGRSMSQFQGFSLRWFETLFDNREMMNAIYFTFIIAILATIIATILGTFAAIGLSKSGKILRNIVEQINNLPIMNPEIVTAMGLMLVIVTFQIPKGYLTVLLAHVMICTPYVMLSVMPRLRTLDPNTMDAALDLGATPFYALRKVILPQIRTAMLSGAMIAFSMSFDDFVVTDFVKGAGMNNISTMVYTMKRKNPSIYAMTTIVMAVVLVGLLLINLVPVIRERAEKRKEMSEL